MQKKTWENWAPSLFDCKEPLKNVKLKENFSKIFRDNKRNKEKRDALYTLLINQSTSQFTSHPISQTVSPSDI